MDELERQLYTRKYDDKARYFGEIYIEFTDPANPQNSHWRKCVLQTGVSECEIRLLQYKKMKVLKRYVLKMYSSSKLGSMVHIRMDMDHVSEYIMVTERWHEIVLVDGRKFAILLKGDADHRILVGQLKKALKGKLKDQSRDEGERIYENVRFGKAVLPDEQSESVMKGYKKDDGGKVVSQNLYGDTPSRGSGVTARQYLESLGGEVDEDADRQNLEEMAERRDGSPVYEEINDKTRTRAPIPAPRKQKQTSEEQDEESTSFEEAGACGGEPISSMHSSSRHSYIREQPMTFHEFHVDDGAGTGTRRNDRHSPIPTMRACDE